MLTPRRSSQRPHPDSFYKMAGIPMPRALKESVGDLRQQIVDTQDLLWKLQKELTQMLMDELAHISDADRENYEHQLVTTEEGAITHTKDKDVKDMIILDLMQNHDCSKLAAELFVNNLCKGLATLGEEDAAASETTDPALEDTAEDGAPDAGDGE